MLLILTFVVSCGTLDDRAREAARKKADAGLVGTAIEELGQRPEAPTECRQREFYRLSEQDDANLGLLRADQALTRANNKLEWCADWTDTALGNITEEN